MSTASLLTVLHISDFHFSNRKHRDQGIVVDALVADLKAICVGHRKPDLVIFTGDLVQAAGVDLHDNAYDFMLEPVSKATGCSDERILIIPGNHDLSWKSLEAFHAEHVEWRSIIGANDEMAQFNRRYEAGDFDAAIEKKFEVYSDLEAYLSGTGSVMKRTARNAFAQSHHIPGLDLDFVSVNTAALSTGGHGKFEQDERKLVVPEYALLDISKVLGETTFKIVAAHHPYAMLSETNAKFFEGWVEENADLFLFGHMHDPQPKASVGLKGQVIADQAGAIFTARKGAYIGYSLITIERGKNLAEVHLRSYFDERKAFDAAIDLVPEGKWYSSQEARQYFRTIATPVDEAALRQHLHGTALSALRAEEAASGGDADVHSMFVAPPLIRTNIQVPSGEESKTEIETPVPFADVILDDSNVILYATSEFGRTTLLRELRLQILEKADDLRVPRLPALIDFSDIKTNTQSMLRLVKARVEVIPDGHDLESLLKLGYICLLIDDVVFTDAKKMGILREFITSYPKARYIISSLKSSAVKFGAHVDPEVPVRFDFVEIKELKRNDMRTLLTKFEGCPDVEDWLDRLQNEFKEINLPFTAANGSILAEILQEKHKFSPVNRAVLIEQFVDSTLRKAAIEQSKRETFDYTNKTDLLAQVAAWMARADNYMPAKEELRAEMSRYVNSMGLNVRLDDLIHEFLSARILINRPDERVSFRYRAVLEYFIALRMTSDRDFRQWVLDDARYLQYSHEIQYYAGKLRNDPDLVNDIGERYGAILAEFEQAVGGVNLDKIAELELPRDTDDDSFSALYQKMTAAPLTKEEKDRELDGEIAILDDTSQDMKRPIAREIGDRLLVALNLYSGLIKNMEMISDADKRRHLSVVWRGWAVLLHASILFTPRLAKERRLRINGVLYEILAPHSMKDAALVRQILLGLPIVHIRMVSNALGSEKLERQLTEPGLEEANEPLVYSLLRTGLIAELRLNGTPSAVSSSISKFQGSNYLLRSLMGFLTMMRRYDKLRDDHYERIESSLARAIATVGGKDHKARGIEKGRQVARLAKERLLIKMKQARDK